MTTDLLPFDAIDRAVAAFTAHRDPLVLGGRGIGADATRPMSLSALRGWLLAPDTSFDARDRTIAELVRLARSDERWMTGLIWVLLPGLRSAVHRVTARVPDLAADAQAEALAAVIDAVRHDRLGADKHAARLVRIAAFRAAQLVGREVAVRANCDSFAAADGPARDDRGADALLHEAVAADILTADEAELIAATRIDGVSLRDYAAAHRMSYDVARKRRKYAESRLAASVTELLPSDSPVGGAENRL